MTLGLEVYVSTLYGSTLSSQHQTEPIPQVRPIHRHSGGQLSFRKSFDQCLVSILVTLCFAFGAAGQTSETANGNDHVSRDGTRPSQLWSLKARPVKAQKQNTETFKWRSATRQAWLYTGVMHSFRFATEAGTRDALSGPWLNDWMASVSEIRGWDDGDPFITNYIAHSMEGAIFGFIQQNNDPRYRLVEWGSGRDYWISRLRALSFSAV